MKKPINLQKISGLSNADPIYEWLGMIDEYFKGEYSWDVIHQKVHHEQLLAALFEYMGYPLIRVTGRETPVINDNVSAEQVMEFKNFLDRNGENYFAELVLELSKQISPYEIRTVLTFVFVNLEYLREQEKGRRSIYAGNVQYGPVV